MRKQFGDGYIGQVAAIAGFRFSRNQRGNEFNALGNVPVPGAANPTSWAMYPSLDAEGEDEVDQEAEDEEAAGAAVEAECPRDVPERPQRVARWRLGRRRLAERGERLAKARNRRE